MVDFYSKLVGKYAIPMDWVKKYLVWKKTNPAGFRLEHGKMEKEVVLSSVFVDIWRSNFNHVFLCFCSKSRITLLLVQVEPLQSL